MATPNLNRVMKIFMRRILDPVVESGGVILPGKIILTTADIEEYVSRAMMSLVNMYWEKYEGDIIAFTQMFPELQKTINVASVLSGSYLTVDLDTTTTLADYFQALPSYKIGSPNLKIDVWNSAKFADLVSGDNPFMIAPSTRPAFVEVDRKLYLFPVSLGDDYHWTFVYLFVPLDPETGDRLTSGGTYDSPFTAQWDDKIAEIAEKLYWDDNNKQAGG